MIQKCTAPSPVSRCRYSSAAHLIFYLILPTFTGHFLHGCLSSRIGWMMAISMMAFIVEERTRRELNFTTPRDWTLSYIRDLA